MNGKLHFISGLPRSGSTLLSALLRQNPRFSAGMTSPVGHLFNAMLRETSMRHEDAVFVDDEMRERLLRGVFTSYYNEADADGVTLDTNRGWTTKLHILTKLYPDAKMICCVRNPAWIIDSIESLTRRNTYELSGIFSYEPTGTVYDRAEGLAGNNGMLGFALNALREAIFGPHADRLLLVRYETLSANPMGALKGIYNVLDEPMFEHNPNKLPACYDMFEFDRKLGTPGLHDVGPKVRHVERPTRLPPDIFHRHSENAFWQDPANLPEVVRVV
jgi:sulfotransferase